MTETAIAAMQLSKDYGEGRGCRNVNLHIRTGEAFGFLGPNGAGKSTIVKMLVGLIQPTYGEAKVWGYPAGSVEARRHIGYLPELFRYPDWLTGQEVLTFHSKLCELDRVTAEKRIKTLLDDVGIGQRGSDRIKKYSKGMQQRLGLACALLSDPDIVFLDEPASALDPVGRHEVRQLLGRLKDQGKTIFLNSHLLEDVELLCDHVALLNNGQVLADGTMSEVLNNKARWRFHVGGFTPFILDWLADVFKAPVHLDVEGADSRVDTVWLEAELEDQEQVGHLNYLLIQHGMTVYEIQPIQSRLDDWFLHAVSGLEHRGERR